MLLRVSSFSPSTSRLYSPLVSAGAGFGYAIPGLGASPLQSLVTGGSGEHVRDFRIGPGITITNNALQSNNTRPGLYDSSAVSSRAQTPYKDSRFSRSQGSIIRVGMVNSRVVMNHDKSQLDKTTWETWCNPSHWIGNYAGIELFSFLTAFLLFDTFSLHLLMHVTDV